MIISLSIFLLVSEENEEWRGDAALRFAAAAEGASVETDPASYGTGTAAEKTVAVAGPPGRLRLLLFEEQFGDLFFKRGIPVVIGTESVAAGMDACGSVNGVRTGTAAVGLDRRQGKVVPAEPFGGMHR
jgi:hypothetical protein